MDSLIEAFGTNKQKRALSSRKLNQVGSEILHKAVAKAANAIIDEKGLEGELPTHLVHMCASGCQLLIHNNLQVR